MVGLSAFELMVVGVLVLLFVGPERLPQTIRTLGKLYAQLRRSADDLRRALTLEADRADEEERLRELVRRRKEAEERRRKAAEQAKAPGEPVPQPERHVAPEPAADALPPGFSQEEWDDLPDHVKEIVRRRRAG